MLSVLRFTDSDYSFDIYYFQKEELEQARARVRLEEEKKDIELKQAAETAQRLGEEDEIREHELKQRELKTKIEEHRKAKELQKQQVCFYSNRLVLIVNPKYKFYVYPC